MLSHEDVVGCATREIAIHYGQSCACEISWPAFPCTSAQTFGWSLHSQHTPREIHTPQRQRRRARKNHRAVVIPLKGLAFNYLDCVDVRRCWWWSLPHRDRKLIPTDHIEAWWALDISWDDIKLFLSESVSHLAQVGLNKNHCRLKSVKPVCLFSWCFVKNLANDVRTCTYVNLHMLELCLSKNKLIHNLIISTITQSLMELCYTGKENQNVLFKSQNNWISRLHFFFWFW